MTKLGVIAGVAILCLLYVGWSLRRSKRKLSRGARKKIDTRWEKMLMLDDPVRKLTEADAIFDRVLAKLGYEGTLAEKLKSAGPRFSNLDDVWEAHKLRNRVAHEPGVTVTEKQLMKVLKAFERAIKSIS